MAFSVNNCKKLIQELPEVLFLEDLSGNILQVNPQACEMLGYKEEEMLDMGVKDLVPEDVGPEERLKYFSGHESPRHPELIETVYLDKEGNEIPVELRGRGVEVDGEERVLVSVRGKAERKKAERKLEESQERLEAAMEAGKLAWWEMELPSGEVKFNDRKAEMLGYYPDKFEHYSDFTELIHPEDYEKAMEAIRAHLDGKKRKVRDRISNKEKERGL